jgi:hypothetical protein
MRLTVGFDLARFQRELDGQLAQMQRQARRAVNELAWRAREAVKKEMRGVFSAPTPYIISSMRIIPAIDTGNEATLTWKDRDFATGGKAFGALRGGGEILRPHIEGGGRDLKRFETLMRDAGILAPGEFTVIAKSAPKDRYGNIPRSEIVAILSDVRAFNEMGVTANRRRDARATKRKYFAITTYQREHGARRVGLPPGVYIVPRSSGQLPRMVLAFVPRAPAYEAGSFEPAYAARLTFLRDAPDVWRQAVAGQLPFRRLDG